MSHMAEGGFQNLYCYCKHCSSLSNVFPKSMLSRAKSTEGANFLLHAQTNPGLRGHALPNTLHESWTHCQMFRKLDNTDTARLRFKCGKRWDEHHSGLDAGKAFAMEPAAGLIRSKRITVEDSDSIHFCAITSQPLPSSRI